MRRSVAGAKGYPNDRAGFERNLVGYGIIDAPGDFPGRERGGSAV